jgi:hypothetical protein
MFLAGLNNSGIRAILPEPEIPKGGTMPHQPRPDDPGMLHCIILLKIETRRIADDDNNRQSFLRRLGNLSEETQTQCLPGLC